MDAFHLAKNSEIGRHGWLVQQCGIRSDVFAAGQFRSILKRINNDLFETLFIKVL
jgi:hypothetical protein